MKHYTVIDFFFDFFFFFFFFSLEGAQIILALLTAS